MVREHNATAWAVYTTAALQRSKKMPTLRKLMLKERTKPQSPEQMLAIAKQWTLLLGGEVKNQTELRG